MGLKPFIPYLFFLIPFPFLKKGSNRSLGFPLFFSLFFLLFFTSNIGHAFLAKEEDPGNKIFSPHEQDEYFQLLQKTQKKIKAHILANGPPTPKEWYREGQAYFDAGFFSKAAVYAMMGLEGERSHTHRESLFLLVRTLMTLRLFSPAIPYLEDLIDEKTGEEEAPLVLFLAEAYFNQGNYSEAAAIINDLPDSLLSLTDQGKKYFIQGMSLLYMGHYNKAMLFLNRVPPDHDRHLFSHYAIALSYKRLGNPSMSVFTLRELTQQASSSDHQQSLYFRDWAYLILGEYLLETHPKEAREALERVRSESPFFQRSLFDLAWSYIQNSEYVKAIVVFRKLADLYPDSIESWEGLVTIGYCYSRLSAYEKAVAHYRSLLDGFTRSLQKIDLELEQVNQERKNRFSFGERQTREIDPIHLGLIFDSTFINLQFLLVELRQMKNWFISMNGKSLKEEQRYLERLGNRVLESMRKRVTQENSRKKRILEDLLVRSSLGIARNLSPLDLGRGRP